MEVVNTILNVRPDSTLEKAIANDILVDDDKDLKESFLQQMSVDYGPKEKPTHKIVENPDEQDPT